MVEKVWNNSDDVNVAVRKVYAKANDAYGYVDSKYTTKVTAEELENAFIKGLIVVGSDGTFYKPISCKVASNVATITYATTDSTTATSAKLATIKSE